MWRSLLTRLFCCLMMAIFSHAGLAAGIKQINQHVKTWNTFTENLFRLHKRQLKQKKYSKKTRIGGYAQLPGFYREESYYAGERMLSKVRWERKQPERLHSIEVNIYDKRGRVIRDYAAAFLPYYHHAPSQTLITLHRYNGRLHAFRTFDASGFLMTERCRGTLRGAAVNILLDEDEIDSVYDGPAGRVVAQDEYRACFDGLQRAAGKYLDPQ